MANYRDIKLARVNINLPTKLVNRVRDYARSNGLPYTQAYVLLLNQGLKENSMMEMLPSVLSTLTDIKYLSKQLNEKD
jgi:predicted DNA binding CopG/RHH family protein